MKKDCEQQGMCRKAKLFAVRMIIFVNDESLSQKCTGGYGSQPWQLSTPRAIYARYTPEASKPDGRGEQSERRHKEDRGDPV